VQPTAAPGPPPAVVPAPPSPAPAAAPPAALPAATPVDAPRPSAPPTAPPTAVPPVPPPSVPSLAPSPPTATGPSEDCRAARATWRAAAAAAGAPLDRLARCLDGGAPPCAAPATDLKRALAELAAAEERMAWMCGEEAP
jgi:hypothetical protein